MLPRKLILENIGPFIYETIDFTTFLDQGLFLITGKTGAGKSTILDAISFALFGETIGNTRQAKELRSNFALPTSLCQVTFEFSHQANLYKITRSPQQQIAKKRGSGFREQKPQALLTVFDLAGNEVETISGQAKVNLFLQDLLQLNRQQFSQIMLLPQGEFRRFLLADSEEKTKLLRTLFATLDYQRLTEWFKEQLAKRRQNITRQFDQLTQLQSQFQWQQTLSEEELVKQNDFAQFIELAKKALVCDEAGLKNQQEKLADLKSQITTLHQQIEHGQLLKHQQEEYQTLLNEQASLQARQAEFDQLKMQIASLDFLKEQLPFWQQFADELAQLNTTKLAFQQAKMALTQAQTEWENWQKTKEDEQQLALTIRQLQEQLSQITQILPLAELYEQKQTAWQQTNSQLALKRQVLQDQLALLAEQQAQYAIYSSQQEALNQQAELQASWQVSAKLDYQLSQTVLSLEEIWQNYQQQASTLQELEQTNHQLAAEKASFMPEYIACQQENIELLKLRLQLSLQEDEPCPICGSTTHPAVSQQDEQAQKTSQANLMASEAKLQDFKQKHEALLTKESRLTTQITQVRQALTQAWEQFSQQLTTYQENFQQVATFAPNIIASFPLAIEQSYQALQKNVDQLIKLASPSQANFSQQALSILTIIRQSQAQWLAFSKEVENVKRTLDQKWQTLTTEMTTLKEAIAKLDENTKTSQGDLQQIELQNEKLAGEIASLQTQLANRSFAELAQRKTQVTTQLADLQLKVQLNQEKTQALKQQCIRQEETLRLTEQQKHQQYQQLQNKVPIFAQSIEQLTENSIFDLVVKDHNTAPQVLANSLATCRQITKQVTLDTITALPINDLLALKDTLAQLPILTEQYQQAMQRMKMIEKRLAELYPISQQAVVDIQALQQKVQALQQTSDESQQQYATLTLIYQQNQQVLATFIEVFQANQAELSATGEFAQLTDTLSGKNQQNLSLERYVLQVYFNEILKVANQRLLQLTKGRYTLLIDQSKGSYVRQTGLELLIYDAHSGENRRVQTLSGGESFIVALSLALSLADVIQQQSGGIQIEALFIDEGFGTLDEEALAQALAALMQIESEGRLIGIISHVRELKEQIYQQLQVKAKGNGQSVLRSQSLVNQ